MASDDIDDLMDSDRQKVQRAVSNARSGSMRPHPAKLLETVLWAGSILFVVFMVAAMPFTGEDAILPGQMWLGVSLGGIIIPAVLAVLIRFLRTGGFAQVDRAVEQTLEK